jgi:16S rRNA (adenine1518-N6/adenine1519-N6)-dimethyltransferase
MKNKFGQNFLIDKKIALREVEHANINKDDVILEVGPGRGILTELMAQRAKKVIAIEIDKNLINDLQRFLPDNVMLINDDAVNVDLKRLPRFNKIVSNLPFQISSPITFKLLNYDFKLAVLIYQKEFANRMVAKPNSKNYSRLSVNVYYKACCEIVEVVPKTCFKPQPKVNACIIKLIPRKNPPFSLENEEFFFNLIKGLFSQRRKKIKNTLQSLYRYKNNDMPYLNNRVEELTPEQIGELSNILYKLYR